MAYAASTTYANKVIVGRLHTTATTVETGGTTNAHEFTVEAPALGTLTFHKCTLATGGAGITATVVDPQVGEATGATASVFTNGTAAASTRNAPDARFDSVAGLLYCRSVCDGAPGSTGTVTTVQTWVEGHI